MPVLKPDTNVVSENINCESHLLSTVDGHFKPNCVFSQAVIQFQDCVSSASGKQQSAVATRFVETKAMKQFVTF